MPVWSEEWMLTSLGMILVFSCHGWIYQSTDDPLESAKLFHLDYHPAWKREKKMSELRLGVGQNLERLIAGV